MCQYKIWIPTYNLLLFEIQIKINCTMPVHLPPGYMGLIFEHNLEYKLTSYTNLKFYFIPFGAFVDCTSAQLAYYYLLVTTTII